MTTRTYTNRFANIKVDPNEPGLVVGYDMVPNGTIVPDVSSGGFDGQLQGKISFENNLFRGGIKYTGLSDQTCAILTAYSGLANNFTVSTWFKPFSSGAIAGRIFDGQGLSLYLLGTNVVFAWDSGTMTIPNGWYQNLWFRFDVIQDSNAIKLYINGIKVSQNLNLHTPSIVNFTIGNTSGFNRSSDGIFSQFAIYNDGKTDEWVNHQYELGKKAIFQGQSGVVTGISSTGGSIDSGPLYVSFGTFDYQSEIVNGNTVQSIRCVSAGIAYLNTGFMGQSINDAAYGYWGIWLYHVDATTSFFYPISNSPNGQAGDYRLSISATNQLLLTRQGAVDLFVTAPNFVTPDVYNFFEIYRIPGGKFSVYLNGTLVDPSGGSGTNPVVDNTTQTAMNQTVNLATGSKYIWSCNNNKMAFKKRLIP